MAVSTWTSSTSAKIAVDSRNDLDSPIELNDHVLSPFAVRDFHYQDCHFHSVAHLMCYRYAVLNDFKLMATSVRKWSKHLTEFPIVRFVTQNWQILCRSILGDIYIHLCLNDVTVSEALVNTGPRPFVLRGHSSQGALNDIWTQMPGGFICVLFAKRFVGIIGKVRISSLWKCISYKNPMVHYFTVAS